MCPKLCKTLWHARHRKTLMHLTPRRQGKLLCPTRGEWKGAWPAVLPSAFLLWSRLTRRKVTERLECRVGALRLQGGGLPSAARPPPPLHARLRQPSVIPERAATRQADTGGQPDGLTSGEMERPERTARPKQPRRGRTSAGETDATTPRR